MSRCDYYEAEWACREGGYLWDTDGDGYDPSDRSYPCPKCNTREYLNDAVENSQGWSGYQGYYTSGAESFRYRVEKAKAANPAEASRVLNEIGPVVCDDWSIPGVPDLRGEMVVVIENAQRSHP